MNTIEKIEENKKLIGYVLRKMNITKDNHLYEDYYQVGLITLNEVISNHNPNKGKLSTFAFFKLRKAFQTLTANMYDNCISYKCLTPFCNAKRNLSLDYEKEDSKVKIKEQFISEKTPDINNRIEILEVLTEIDNIELITWVYDNRKITKEEEKRYEKLIRIYHPESKMKCKSMKQHLKSIYFKRIKKLYSKNPKAKEVIETILDKELK